MSTITGVALNAVYPSGLIDRPNQATVPPARQDSPLFTTVSQPEPTERGLNRRELNPDERRQDNQRGRPLNLPNETANDPSRNDESASQLRTRQALEAAQRRGELNAEQEAKLAEIQQLAERDREVRSHEEAHRAVAGQYAGPISYQFVQGPDGRRYAVAGEVPIDLSPAATPEQTAAKMEQVRRAALAPVEPSPADRRVASEAMQLMLQARQEAVRLRTQSEEEAPESDIDIEATDSSDRSEGSAASVSRGLEASEPDTTSAVQPSEDNDLQDRANDDAERDAALDERRNAINTESALRQAELQALIAEILRNQGASLDDVILGRNVNFQI